MSVTDLFDARTPRFDLPLLFAGQAQKEPFLNEVAMRADMLMHCAVEGAQGAPPLDPQAGQCWLVAETPADAWTGQAGKIAMWAAGTWIFVAPRAGMTVYDRAGARFIHYDQQWHSPPRPAAPVGGSVVDSEARAALAALLDALTQAGVIPAN